MVTNILREYEIALETVQKLEDKMNEVGLPFARKLWLSYRLVAYEGDDALGVFSTKEKAIEECQRYENEHSGDDPRELNFYQHQTSENHPTVFLADGYNYEYCVREIEVNKTLMP